MDPDSQSGKPVNGDLSHRGVAIAASAAALLRLPFPLRVKRDNIMRPLPGGIAAKSLSFGRLSRIRAEDRALIGTVPPFFIYAPSMSNESRYRERARMCREEASLRWGDPVAQQHWVKLAEEYDNLAETEVLMAPRHIPAPVQRQPMQQQQSKAEPKDDK